MIHIRFNRLRKNRTKNKSLVLGIKVFAIGYMTFGTLYYLSSSTNASFSDTETVNAEFLSKVDKEMDKPLDASSLKITVIGEQGGDLTFIFKNMNDLKIEYLDYELYFSEKHSPKEGAQLLKGSIRDIEQAHEKKLALKAAKGAGKYILKVNLSKEVIIWSEEVIIQNTEEPKQGNDSESDKTTKNNQEVPPTDATKPNELEVTPEPDKNDSDDEVIQQETEKNSEMIDEQDANTSQSDGTVSGLEVDSEESHLENEQANNE